MEGMVAVKIWMWVASWIAGVLIWAISFGIIYGKLVSNIKSLTESVKPIPEMKSDIKVIKEHQTSQDRKIAENCKSLTDLRRSGIITVKEHNPMCGDKWKHHDKNDDQRKGEIDRRLNKSDAELVSVRSAMKEQQNFITEAKVVMATTTTTLKSVQETIKEVPNMIRREVASLVSK